MTVLPIGKTQDTPKQFQESHGTLNSRKISPLIPLGVGAGASGVLITAIILVVLKQSSVLCAACFVASGGLTFTTLILLLVMRRKKESFLQSGPGPIPSRMGYQAHTTFIPPQQPKESFQSPFFSDDWEIENKNSAKPKSESEFKPLQKPSNNNYVVINPYTLTLSVEMKTKNEPPVKPKLQGEFKPPQIIGALSDLLPCKSEDEAEKKAALTNVSKKVLENWEAYQQFDPDKAQWTEDELIDSLGLPTFFGAGKQAIEAVAVVIKLTLPANKIYSKELILDFMVKMKDAFVAAKTAL